MIGLGVGIDYALFLVTRHPDSSRRHGGPRVDRTRGRDDRAARSCSPATTVVIALLSLAVAGIPLVTSLGYASAVAVAHAVLAAITLLPALLSLVGHRIDSLRLPAFLRPKPKGPGQGFWAALGAVRHRSSVDGRPRARLRSSCRSRSPSSRSQLGQEDIGATPKSTTERQAYDLIAAGFGVGLQRPAPDRDELDPPATADLEVVTQENELQSLQNAAPAGAEGGSAAAEGARAGVERAEAAAGEPREAAGEPGEPGGAAQAAAVEPREPGGAARAAAVEPREPGGGAQAAAGQPRVAGRGAQDEAVSARQRSRPRSNGRRRHCARRRSVSRSRGEHSLPGPSGSSRQAAPLRHGVLASVQAHEQRSRSEIAKTEDSRAGREAEGAAGRARPGADEDRGATRRRHRTALRRCAGRRARSRPRPSTARSGSRRVCAARKRRLLVRRPLSRPGGKLAAEQKSLEAQGRSSSRRRRSCSSRRRSCSSRGTELQQQAAALQKQGAELQQEGDASAAGGRPEGAAGAARGPAEAGGAAAEAGGAAPGQLTQELTKAGGDDRGTDPRS